MAQNYGLSSADVAIIREGDEDVAFELALSNLLGEELDDELVMNCLDVILQACQDDREADFDDMIWLPVVCDVMIPKFKWVLIDEAQDFNPCQIRFLEKVHLSIKIWILSIFLFTDFNDFLVSTY